MEESRSSRAPDGSYSSSELDIVNASAREVVFKGGSGRKRSFLGLANWSKRRLYIRGIGDTFDEELAVVSERGGGVR
jgi:hypothetical protein